MARRKKEQNSTDKKSKALVDTLRHSPNEENVHVDALNAGKANMDDDGGNSSPDESTSEDAEMLKPEDIQNIVIGDLKTVCVTKATSDDEVDALSKRYRTLSAGPEPSKNFSTSQSTTTPTPVAPIPPPNPAPPTCEHPKKKIVRLMNAAQYFNQDIVGTLKPAPAEPKILPETHFNPARVKYNGELLANAVVRSDSIKSEPACDAISSSFFQSESPHSDGVKQQPVKVEERNFNYTDLESLSRRSAENSEERGSYQDIDEILRKTAPFLRNLTNKLKEEENCGNSSLAQTETISSSTQNQLADISKERFSLSSPTASEADEISNTPLSVKLTSDSLACDTSDSTMMTEKKTTESVANKSETLGCKSALETKSIPQITTFDFLSCERSGKRFTKPESVDQCATPTQKSNVTIINNFDAKVHDESAQKMKNNIMHENKHQFLFNLFKNDVT
jgi:hypothetical protein